MKNRVKVTDESASFNAQGKSVFFNFILDCDMDIIPYNEVLVYRNIIRHRDWVAVSISMIGLVIITSGQISNTNLQIGK